MPWRSLAGERSLYDYLQGHAARMALEGPFIGKNRRRVVHHLPRMAL